MGLNFVEIKFRGFRGFRKNREIKSRRKICNKLFLKLNPLEKLCKIRLIREIFYFFLNKLTQSLFDTNGVFLLFLPFCGLKKHDSYILIRLLFLVRGFEPLFSLFCNLQGLHSWTYVSGQS